ncbi:hypothetical protein IFO70_27160 [Phormidium tenue FACHB-886]|nr:hypothetical protein [Phormidium tenue FACHB-886]
MPVQVTQQQMPPELEQFFSYLNDQKYTLWLGDDRGACGYYIDPSDLYEQGNSRFTTAKVSRGMQGTACAGIVEFQVLQADCQANKLYQFVRETEGDPRRRGWQRLQLRLSDSTQPSFPAATQQSVAEICALPAKPAS